MSLPLHKLHQLNEIVQLKASSAIVNYFERLSLQDLICQDLIESCHI